VSSTGDVSSQFLLESAMDWIGSRLSRVARPFVGYFHLMPPHGPYNTSHEFYNQFRDDDCGPWKPEDIFTEQVSMRLLSAALIDEFIRTSIGSSHASMIRWRPRGCSPTRGWC
jgi:hypothetical protein